MVSCIRSQATCITQVAWLCAFGRRLPARRPRRVHAEGPPRRRRRRVRAVWCTGVLNSQVFQYGHSYPSPARFFPSENKSDVRMLHIYGQANMESNNARVRRCTYPSSILHWIIDEFSRKIGRQAVYAPRPGLALSIAYNSVYQCLMLSSRLLLAQLARLEQYRTLIITSA